MGFLAFASAFGQKAMETSGARIAQERKERIASQAADLQYRREVHLQQLRAQASKELQTLRGSQDIEGRQLTADANIEMQTLRGEQDIAGRTLTAGANMAGRVYTAKQSAELQSAADKQANERLRIKEQGLIERAQSKSSKLSPDKIASGIKDLIDSSGLDDNGNPRLSPAEAEQKFMSWVRKYELTPAKYDRIEKTVDDIAARAEKAGRPVPDSMKVQMKQALLEEKQTEASIERILTQAEKDENSLDDSGERPFGALKGDPKSWEEAKTIKRGLTAEQRESLELAKAVEDKLGASKVRRQREKMTSDMPSGSFNIRDIAAAGREKTKPWSDEHAKKLYNKLKASLPSLDASGKRRVNRAMKKLTEEYGE